MARKNPHQPTIHEVQSSSKAVDLSTLMGTRGVTEGDVVVIPSEGVVGVVEANPIAVTREAGGLYPLETSFDVEAWANRSWERSSSYLPHGVREPALIAGFHAAVEEAERRGFPLSKAARFAAAKHHHAAMPRRNPVREQFDFDRYEEYARRLSNDQLHYSIQDALRALDVARTWDDGGAGEAKYLDQLSVLRRERDARRARQNPMVVDGGGVYEEIAYPYGRAPASFNVAKFDEYARDIPDDQLDQAIADATHALNDARSRGDNAAAGMYDYQAGILRFVKNIRSHVRSRRNPSAKAAHGARKNPAVRLETWPCVQAYLEAALETSTVEAGDDEPLVGEGEPYDKFFTIEDFSVEAVLQAEKDCQAFMDNNDVGDLDYEEIGRNYWLTRNHHGTGFWDLGLGALGQQLTKSAHADGETDVYTGADGKLYLI